MNFSSHCKLSARRCSSLKTVECRYVQMGARYAVDIVTDIRVQSRMYRKIG